MNYFLHATIKINYIIHRNRSFKMVISNYYIIWFSFYSFNSKIAIYLGTIGSNNDESQMQYVFTNIVTSSRIKLKL